MSFFSKFHKAGTTAITQQDIKVKTVKVANTATVPHPLPIIAHQRPATPRSASSTNLTQITTTSTTTSTTTTTIKAKSMKSKRNNLLSPPPGSERGRDSKNGRDRSAGRGDITRDRSLKRKESSSSFTRLDSPTSSLRSVSSSTESVTSHSKKRRLTPSAPHHRNSPIQEKLVSSDEESDSASDDDARAGSKEERLRKLQEAQELGLTTRVYLNPKSFKPERMSFVHADQIANMKKEGYRRGISLFFFASYVVVILGVARSLFHPSSWCILHPSILRAIHLFSMGTCWTNALCSCVTCSFPRLNQSP